MSPATRSVFLVSLVLGLVSVSLQAQSQSKTSISPLATISGKVTIKGKPAPGVMVSVRRQEFSGQPEILPSSTTDQEGFYKITNVIAGAYQVVVSKPAFLANYNARATLVVSEGENIEDVNFALVRGGVITGKVTDADGRPVIQQQVMLFRADAFNPSPNQPQRSVTRLSSTSTDDRGIYRMFGLAQGSYKVAVGRIDGTFSGPFRPTEAAFQPVYYPDSADPLKSTNIDVSEGSESTNIDLSLGRPLQTFSVSGRIEDESGQPIRNMRILAYRMSGISMPEMGGQAASPNREGDFLVEGLVPGKYRLSVSGDRNSEVRADPVDVDIIDQNITGITFRMSKGASITGVVVLENENNLAVAKLTQVMLGASVRSPDGPNRSGGSSEWIGGDGSFRLVRLSAGVADFYLSGGSNQQFRRFAISRVERDGVVQPAGIEIKEREQITGIRVVLSYGSATLRGTVNIQNAVPPPGAMIMVRITRAGNPTATRMLRADARGRFLTEGIAPGPYDVTAIVSIPRARLNPPPKQQVTLQDGVTTDLVLNIDLAPKQP